MFIRKRIRFYYLYEKNKEKKCQISFIEAQPLQKLDQGVCTLKIRFSRMILFWKNIAFLNGMFVLV